MTQSLVIIELVLVACIVGGWVLGRILSARLATRRGDDAAEESEGSLTDALAFVGAAFGIILGLLLVFAVDHFNDARSAARSEAVSAVALFRSANPYDEAERHEMQRSILCTMRSIVADDWRAEKDQQISGSPNTNAWMQRTQNAMEALSQNTDIQQSAHEVVFAEGLDLFKDRQLLLVSSQPEIPSLVWLVIFACTFAFVLLLVMHLGTRRRLAAISVSAIAVVLLVIVGSLTNLDYPFEGSIGNLKPVAMESSLMSLQQAFPNSDWSPCEQLAAPTQG
jgi:hypothetical protein